MPVIIKDNKFHLYTHQMSYCMELTPYGDLSHVYWGPRIGEADWECWHKNPSSFSSTPAGDPSYSLDAIPQEYPLSGGQDLRPPAFRAEQETGNSVLRPVYESHVVMPGKPRISGLPSTYVESTKEATTLLIRLRDEDKGLHIHLYYTLFEETGAICRHAEFENAGSKPLWLTNVDSACVDFSDMDFRYLQLTGAWAREKQAEWCPVHHGLQGVESRRGASGHQFNPFLALLRPDATEDRGDAYGVSLVYSGNYHIDLYADPAYSMMRLRAGIHPDCFRWKLEKDGRFSTPEVVLAYSPNGLTGVSQTYHTLYRTRLCRGYWRDQPRPVLVNSWEASYFDFNEKKLVSLAKKAAGLGVELFVLDDGWFGERNDDTSSLGDWHHNPQKLPHGLAGLSDKIHSLGLKFGLWFEPEMVSPNSALYRAHPNWALHVPGQTIHQGRNQYILDLTQQEVRDYLLYILSTQMERGKVDYVKWDMNRNMADVYSASLPEERQGEVAHRYMLGLYQLLEQLVARFPKVLFESCSGGGGRNDPGMLYYMPQTWVSDNTDAIDRLYIQYGASMAYPASSVGAHVSAVPNHQNGRYTNLRLRGQVAMAGMLGYELDLTRLSREEDKEVTRQIKEYKRLRKTIMSGTHFRLADPFTQPCAAWMFLSPNGNKGVVSYVHITGRVNAPARRLKLKGLEPDDIYRIQGKLYSGRTLMHYGIVLPDTERDGEFHQFELKRMKTAGEDVIDEAND